MHWKISGQWLVPVGPSLFVEALHSTKCLRYKERTPFIPSFNVMGEICDVSAKGLGVIKTVASIFVKCYT